MKGLNKNTIIILEYDRTRNQLGMYSMIVMWKYHAQFVPKFQ